MVDTFQEIEFNIDRKKFIEEQFLIRDKNEKLVPFLFNPVQEKYYSILLNEYGHLEGSREIILKARQEGMSSFILALFAADFITRPNSVNVCISHRQDITKKLFKKVRFYIESYCGYNNFRMEDYLSVDTKEELENRTNGSYFYIGTAGARVGGRGGTVSNLHFCVGEETPVLTMQGWKRIDELRRTDEVVTNTGRIVPVHDVVMMDGSKDHWYYLNVDGNKDPIAITENHKVMVYSPKGIGDVVFKMAKNLTGEDMIAYPGILNATGLPFDKLPIRKSTDYVFRRVTMKKTIPPREKRYDVVLKDAPHNYMTSVGIIHNSECAFFLESDRISAQEIVEATMQQVPMGKGMVFIESTGSSTGTYYHKVWESAMEGESVFKPRFFSCEEFYTEEWLEEKKKEFQSEDAFRIDYPRTIEEGFLASGSQFFDRSALLELTHHTKEPILMGRIYRDGTIL